MQPKDELERHKMWLLQRESKHIEIGMKVVQKIESEMAKTFVGQELPEITDSYGYRNQFNGICGAWFRVRIPPACLHIEKYEYQCLDVGIQKQNILEGNTQAHEFHIEIIVGVLNINNLFVHAGETFVLPKQTDFKIEGIEDTFLSLTLKPPFKP